MKSLHIFIFLIIASLVVTSCNKEEEGMIINNNQNQTELIANIFGIVLDENDRPVQDALVSYDDITTRTDVDGVYIFNDVTIGNKHNSLKIEKDGFFEGAHTFRSSSTATQYQVTKLLSQSFDQSFMAATGGNFSKDNMTISFRPNSIVLDSDGSAYQGEVQVAMSPISPDSEELGQIMPGDLSALDNSEAITTLESYGMINVALRSPSGEQLQIANGQKAVIDLTLTLDQLQTAPASIDLWSFDYDRGLWIQEGVATLDGDTYTGEVSHFSCWNYDVSLPSVVVNGRLLLNQEGLAFSSISILNAQNAGGRGKSDQDGYFSGRVPKGEVLTLRVFEPMCVGQNISFLTKEIGPFDQDTDLGEIEVNDISAIDVFSISGTALNCNLEKITDGIIKLSNRYTYPITDGDFSFTIPVCGTGTFDVTIVDRFDLKETTINNLAFPGVEDLNQVEVCSADTDFVSLENLFFAPINLVDSLFLNEYTTALDDVEGSIDAYLFSEFLEISLSLRFNIGNAFNMDELSVDTYPLGDSRLYYSDDTGLKESYSGNQGSVTVESITPVSSNAQLVEGYYVFEGVMANGESKTFTGNFRIEQNK